VDGFDSQFLNIRQDDLERFKIPVDVAKDGATQG
jgi:hypothetical protein